MSSEMEALVAEFQDEAPRKSSSSPSDEASGVDMTFDIESEIAKRGKSMARILARTDPEYIQAGVNAYQRDLPRLLREDRERHVVAYDGSKQVGIARTIQELIQDLKRDGITNHDNLFIKHVTRLDD